MSSALDAPCGTLPTRAEEDRWIWQRFRHHSRTFSLAARLLPRAVRLPVATLYLFCRRVDTLADERPLQTSAADALAELHGVRRRLEATLAGHPPPGRLLWRRLHEVHRAVGLHPQPLHELIDGAVWDLEGRGIETTQDLIDYANLVGGSIGAMMLPFLAEGDADCARLEPAARTLGIAMQITNIIRDVGEDARELGRVYLPSAWLRAHGLSSQILFTGDAPVGATGGAAAAARTNGSAPPPASEPPVPDGYPDLLEQAMNAAEARYLESFSGIDALPFRARAGIRAAARMYRDIMNEVRAGGYDNLRRRAYVPLPRKLRLVVHDDYARRKARLLACHADR